MKENGMNKLIELLNEHIEENTGQKYYLNERDVKDKLDSLLILRHFIKWLVENDKIDFELDRIIHRHKGIDFNTGKGIALEKLCDKYESLLMILSIQDNPIEFLISILK